MPQAVAITREVSAALADCELTHLARVPIDVDVARTQHHAYERALTDAGYLVEHLDADAEMPDSVFVEDMAVVFDELAILTRPGAESRRREMPAIAAALARYRPLQAIQTPATIDGGDVLVAGRRVFVGRSSRTNDAAIVQMRRILGVFGYQVSATAVRGCLHLKSAVTSLGDDRLLRQPRMDRHRGVRRLHPRGRRACGAVGRQRAAAGRSHRLCQRLSAHGRANCGTRSARGTRRRERTGESRRRRHLL